MTERDQWLKKAERTRVAGDRRGECMCLFCVAVLDGDSWWASYYFAAGIAGDADVEDTFIQYAADHGVRLRA